MLPSATPRLSVVVLASIALATGLGCSHNVQIPPSRPLTLEGPKTVGADKRRGRVQVASHGAIFGASFRSGNARLRLGQTDELELSVDGSVIAEASVGSAYLGRLGGKYNPFGGANLALTGGVGAGYSFEGGGMVSSDGGVIVGFNNRYVVPFAHLNTFISAPVAARELRTGSEPDQIDTATLTAGTGVSVGLAVIRDSYSLSVGFDQTLVRDEDGSEVFFSAGAALEFAID